MGFGLMMKQGKFWEMNEEKRMMNISSNYGFLVEGTLRKFFINTGNKVVEMVEVEE